MSEEKQPTKGEPFKPNDAAYARTMQAIAAGVFILGFALAGSDASIAVKLPISSGSITLMLFGGITALYCEVVARGAERKASRASSSGPKEAKVAGVMGAVGGVFSLLTVSAALLIGWTVIGQVQNAAP